MPPDLGELRVATSVDEDREEVDGMRELGGSEPRGVLLEYADGTGRP